MKFFATVNGRPFEVEVVEHLGEIRVQVDGEPLEISYEEVDALGQVALLAGQRSFGVSIEGDEARCTVAIAGVRYDVEIEDERERAAHAADRAAGKKGGVVHSVMPGVVVKVLVAEGESVEEGQPLLLLEAMKMQNEIAAPHAGVVKRLHVKEGEAVAGGAALATIDPVEPA